MSCILQPRTAGSILHNPYDVLKKLLLISPANNFFPLSCAYVMGVLRRNDIPYQFLDLSLENLDVPRLIHKNEYFAVATGGLVTTFMDAEKIITEFKRHAPDLPAILGGRMTACISMDMFDKYMPADYIVFGEAELTFIELLEHLEKNDEHPGRMKSIAYRENGRFTCTPKRPWMDLEKHPIYPCWDDVDLEYYLKNAITIPDARLMPVITGLGCVGKCTFCASGTGAFRARPIEDVIHEIETLSESYDFEGFTFQTEIFYPKTNQIRAFCEAYIATGINKPWKALLRPDTDPDCLKYMGEAGCKFISTGLESGDDRVLRQMNKKSTVENCRRLVREGKRVGINMHCSIMFGSVGESAETIKKTVAVVCEEGVDFGPAFTTTYPGTVLYQKALEEGRITDEYEYLENLEFLFPAAHTFKNAEYLNLSGMDDESLFNETAKQIHRASLAKYQREMVADIDLEAVVGDCRQCGSKLRIPFQPWCTFDMNATCQKCWEIYSFFLFNHSRFGRHVKDLRDRLSTCRRVAVFGTDRNAYAVRQYGEVIGLDPTTICGFLTDNYKGQFFFDKPVIQLKNISSLNPDCVLLADSVYPRAVLKQLEVSKIPSSDCVDLTPPEWPEFILHYIKKIPAFFNPKQPFYFPYSEIELDDIARDLAESLKQSSHGKMKIMLGFSGGFAGQIASIFEKKGMQVIGFVDNDKPSGEDIIWEKPYFNPRELRTNDWDMILICTPSFNAQMGLKQTLLASLGLGMKSAKKISLFFEMFCQHLLSTSRQLLT